MFLGHAHSFQRPCFTLKASPWRSFGHADESMFCHSSWMPKAYVSKIVLVGLRCCSSFSIVSMLLDRSHIQLRICFLSRIGLSWCCSQHFLWPGYHGFFLRCSIMFNHILSKGRASRWRPSGPLDGIGSAAGGPVVTCCCMIWMMLICSHGMLHAK